MKYYLTILILLVFGLIACQSNTSNSNSEQSSNATVKSDASSVIPVTVVPVSTPVATAVTTLITTPVSIPVPQNNTNNSSQIKTKDSQPNSNRPLDAVCTFDESIPRISCHAINFVPDKLRWESNASGWRTGSVYEFELKEKYQLIPEVKIILEQCLSSKCEKIELNIDTSVIVGNTPIDNPTSDNNSNRSRINADSDPADIIRNRWDTNCVGEGSPMFSVSPMAPGDIDYIGPLGALSGVHITPTSHQYYYPKENLIADIVSPVDGNIIWLTNRGTANAENTFGGASGQSHEIQYVIEHSCDFYVVLDHVLDVPEKIKNVVGDNWNTRARIPVKTGELLGKHPDGFKLDISVIDLTRDIVTGLVNPKAYYGGSDGQAGEPFKLFERDSFEYYEEPLRSAMEDKSLRTISPRGGFFGYDIEGTLQGNWYVGGTSYAGTEGKKDSFGAYYKTHAALVPDNVDPSKLIVSIGDDFRDKEMGVNYGITLPAPSFDSVTTKSGIVMYELRRLAPCDGSDPVTAKGRSRSIVCNTNVMGTVLLQLIDAGTMKLEVFFKTSISSDLTFTNKARIYTR